MSRTFRSHFVNARVVPVVDDDTAIALMRRREARFIRDGIVPVATRHRIAEIERKRTRGQ